MANLFYTFNALSLPLSLPHLLPNALYFLVCLFALHVWGTKVVTRAKPNIPTKIFFLFSLSLSHSSSSSISLTSTHSVSLIHARKHTLSLINSTLLKMEKTWKKLHMNKLTLSWLYDLLRIPKARILKSPLSYPYAHTHTHSSLSHRQTIPTPT